MIKLFGAVLVLLGCGGIGFSVVAAYRYQESSLQQLIRALEHMECELQYRMTPLPELCNSASQVCTGCIRGVLQQLNIELEAQITPNASACMHTVVTRCENLTERIRKCLVQLGDSLGCFDLAGQLQGLRSTKKYAEFELDKLQRNQDVRLRSYRTLGICAGAVLVVLFL